MSSNPYQKQYQNAPQGGNPRQTEAWALTEAARRIAEAQQEQPFDEHKFLTAIRLNWRLWTIFQAELCAPDCPVPTDIRHNMLALSNYIDKVTVGLIADPKPEKAKVLVNINRQIAAGLFQNPEQQQQESTAPTPAPPGGLDFSA